MMSPSKQNKTKKILFVTALWCNWLRSYAVSKTTEICLILGQFPGMLYLYTGSQGVKKVFVTLFFYLQPHY